ncbi:Endoglucanase E precursor [Botrimarina colliarenosi]|uniref:Endoglucanase E n=1 Tax=Botrimarina colliarenosi TaxID=2528001 RepID=A0A5C6A6R0_9BACT|nr:GDSL-type esterase/lipase family protein [Botrimarina colliarenosi]TWT94761.1 Endoglucanase E precursor [Botrimarina colliarenosi]
MSPPTRLLLLTALLSASTATRAEVVPSANYRNHVAVEGRTAQGTEGALRIAYPGVTLRLRIDGPKLVLHCRASSDDVYLDVAIDGGEYERQRLSKGENELVLFDGEAGEHNIEVVKRTESWQGELVVDSFDAGDGRFLDPPPRSDRRLLFIGDSITCGAGADVRPEDPPQGAQNSSGRHAFGWLLARRLGAQAHLVSYGGRGIVRTWEGKRWPEEINAPQLYGRALPDDATSAWDAARYVPDAVGVCLGTNDFNLGIPDEEEFVTAYQNLLRRVRADAPQARAFVLDSPMYGPGEKGDAMRRYLDRVVAGLDDDRIERVSLQWRRGRPVDPHPVANEHVLIADEIEPVLRRRLGW